MEPTAHFPAAARSFAAVINLKALFSLRLASGGNRIDFLPLPPTAFISLLLFSLNKKGKKKETLDKMVQWIVKSK